MLKQKDINQIKKIGISEPEIERQLANFKNGISPINLLKAATINDGISAFDSKKEKELIQLFHRFKDSLDIVKFVPASGAATRMFKVLFEGMEVIKNDGEFSDDFKSFFNQLMDYPFYVYLSLALMYKEETHKQPSKEIFAAASRKEKRVMQRNRFVQVMETILYDDDMGMNYANLPKALIIFHNENGNFKTALAEHFLECISYANSDGKGRIHFTVSKEHFEAVKELGVSMAEYYKKKLNFEIEFSIQNESTNTIAVYDDFSLVRKNDDSLMLRPAGHGALLENLNGINAQLIFIKNIDNVCTSKWHKKNAKYKELLAGRLLEMRENIHNLLNGLIHESGRQKASDIIFNRWGIRVNTEKEIKHILDRPLRVCGMVKNTGEPGGGPFWVSEKDGSKSRQIVESSQVDLTNPEQEKIWKNSSHFNPVDLVCWVENHSGEKFDLMKYRNDQTGFISSKSYEGKNINVQELPGLWNGAMAGWITEFVEVPLHTFNPVKSVLDLMNEGHRE